MAWNYQGSIEDYTAASSDRIVRAYFVDSVTNEQRTLFFEFDSSLSSGAFNSALSGAISGGYALLQADDVAKGLSF